MEALDADSSAGCRSDQVAGKSISGGANVRDQTDVRRAIEKRKGISEAESWGSTNSGRPPMQVFGLRRQIIGNGRAAARLREAKTPDIEAARRRDAVARWRRAVADGLNGERGARAVGVPRSTLYR
jgi:hypothetical protein